jgi:hypothetical protein
MSYDVELHDPKTGSLVEVPLHESGGNVALGGTTGAWLNITYNYSEYFYQHLDAEQGLRWLYGKTGAETVERLQAAIMVLGTVQDSNYWLSTPGNAGYALSILLSWAHMHPDAVWDGD